MSGFPDVWYSDAKKRDMESFGQLFEVSEEQVRQLEAAHDRRIAHDRRMQSFQNSCQSLREWLGE